MTRAWSRSSGGRERELIRVEQPYENHNGGHILFGPDRLLYLGLGDGGDAFDPGQRSQDPSTRLGKLLRTDVEAAEPEWEMVALGFRNPWRFSFDLSTGDLWVADVGQDLWEEVDVVRGGPDGLLNFGWDVYEGGERVEEHEPGPGRLVSPGRGVRPRPRLLGHGRPRARRGRSRAATCTATSAADASSAFVRVMPATCAWSASAGPAADVVRPRRRGRLLFVSASGRILRLALIRAGGRGSLAPEQQQERRGEHDQEQRGGCAACE